jgi:undecaprenyl diphosphate synthase
MTDSHALPQHVAIIMDGNGRWAHSKLRDRVFGHIKGARVAKKVIEHSVDRGLKAVTLYAFSEENWGRPQLEIDFLMRILRRYIVRERASLIRNNIRFQCIGQLDKIPASVRNEVEETIRVTSKNTGLILTFALSYGGRQEMTSAVRELALLVEQGQLKAHDINEELISSFMQTAPLPDPDLLIRTSGEYRLSNFLTWQSVYTELYFTDILWPDFTVSDFDRALESFRSRDRRFGMIKNFVSAAANLTN